MKRSLVVSFAVLLAAAVSGLSTAAGLTRPPRVHISVKPSTGSPTTSFLVSFRAPDRTGRYGPSERRYVLSAIGALGAAGCVANVDRRLPYSRLHARVHITLVPARLGGRWCAGTFRGAVQEIQGPVCPKRSRCPEFASLVATIGRFRFDVHSSAGGTKPSGGGDTTPPTFSGLQSAFACTPGPQRPGQTTPFTLTWKAATDDVTPSSQIVYDIYVSTTAGGEDLSQPTWTTPPGVTTYKTPGLPSHGTFYFVVRARDQAGNEDKNRVEVRGVDPCL